jgi:hypothetical protein
VEWAVWENWSVKLEYDYLDFGSRTVTFNDPLLGAANISVSQRISEVKLGVNYRFGSPLAGCSPPAGNRNRAIPGALRPIKTLFATAAN